MTNIQDKKYTYSYRILVFCSLFATVSCSDKNTAAVKEAQDEQICEIQENLSPIARPMSFAIADNGNFVISDLKNVYLYSHDGQQIRQIGHPGRAKYEYLMPRYVKNDNDTVYVWSAGNLKFIAYTMDGEPVAEYPYHSAIKDFLPAGDRIYIYTAGNADKNIIDVYDKTESKVIHNLGKSSPEHRLLIQMVSPAPLCESDGKIFYATKDKPDIYCYDMNSGSDFLKYEISSDTFSVRKVSGSDDIEPDKTSEYLWSNSQTLYLFPHNGSLFLMTIDGDRSKNGEEYDYEKQNYNLYNAKNGNIAATYTNDSIGSEALLSSNADGLYFIKLSDDETQPHSLHRLIL